MKRNRLLMFVTLAVLLALIVVICPWLRGPEQAAAPAYWPTQGWQSATPEEMGFDSGKLASMLLAIRDKDIKVHSLLVIRNGYAFLDATFYPYDGTTPHDVASVTKSMTTTLIGIAADQGRLALDQPIVSFFPDRPIANRDARKERITVRQLASMSSGLDCTPEVPGSSWVCCGSVALPSLLSKRQFLRSHPAGPLRGGAPLLLAAAL